MKRSGPLKRTNPLRRGDNPLKRTPIKRGASVLRRTRLGRVKSKTLSDYDAGFSAVRPAILARAEGKCEVEDFAFDVYLGSSDESGAVLALGMLYAVECLIVATHVHHRKYRSRRGSNSPDNLLATCRAHHDWIHAHGGFGEPANLLGLALTYEESEDL